MKLFKVALAVVGAALALATAAPQAVAAPAGGEPSGGATPMIIGGGTASNAPWAARLFVNGQQNCSATIIAPTYILTARHCVSSSGSYSFRIGSLDQTSGGTVANGVAITRHSSADLAIVRLDRSVSATYSPLGTASDVAVNQTVQVYGWGATCTNQPEINCQSRYLKYANVRVTSVNCRDYTGGVAVCASRIDGITAGGDSGGPMFASGRQVGVASTSDRATRTAYTNVTAYRSWIRSIAGV
jgi:secreted trypsin-like serine protease